MIFNPEPDTPWLNLIEDTQFDPIFILGDHRSGTTLLYQLLSRAQCFNYVSFYHIIHFQEILKQYYLNETPLARRRLKTKLSSSDLTDRIFDRVKVTPDLPEEYGYILWEKAPFWYLPRLNPRNQDNLVRLAQKVQYTSESQKPLLLKNPWDYPNFSFLKSAFPQAKFIFIHRNPISVINSKIKAMRSALHRKNPYTALLAPGYSRLFDHPFQLSLARLIFSKRLKLGLRLLTGYSDYAARYYKKQIQKLSTDDFIAINYEKLCQTPARVIGKILDFFQLSSSARISFEHLVNPRPLRLLPEIEESLTEIRQQLQPVLSLHGYD